MYYVHKYKFINSLVNSWQQVLFAGTRPDIGLIIFMELDFGVFRVERRVIGLEHENKKDKRQTADRNGSGKRKDENVKRVTQYAERN